MLIVNIILVIKLIIYLLLIACLGAVIGWITNFLAVKLIFRPYQPIKIFGLFTLQGLLPKRKMELAKAIGATVERELLSSEEIFKHLQNPELRNKLTQGIIYSVKTRIDKYIPTIFPGLKDTFMGIIDKIVEKEVEIFFQETFSKTCNDLKDSLPVAVIIEEKINFLDIKELEKMVMSIASKELKHIEIIGAVLGFVIGLIQGGVFLLMLT